MRICLCICKMRRLDGVWGLSHDPISEDSMGIYGLSPQKSAQTLDVLHENFRASQLPKDPMDGPRGHWVRNFWTESSLKLPSASKLGSKGHIT